MSFPKQVLSALNYNEQKLKKGDAEIIAAANYLREAVQMSFDQKLHGLQRRNELNERATTKTLHVSLNFDPSEKLSNETLSLIASTYMQKIGFAGQPFLVYRHYDAAHPHVHVVATTIRDDGSRIHTHNIGRTLSERARKEIEKEFGLVQAQKEKKNVPDAVAPLKIEKIRYGKSATKECINRVVRAVMENYRFCSLPEFNAALEQFNLLADRGTENSQTFKTGGIVFRVLNEKGQKTGTPIKASLLPCQPTLKNLESKFEKNKELKQPFKEQVRKTVDETLKQPVSLEQWIEKLKAKNVYPVLRKSETGMIYGITYVDNISRAVFNGSELGKQYSAAAIQKQLLSSDVQKTSLQAGVMKPEKQNLEVAIDHTDTNKDKSLLEVLATPAENRERLPFQLKKKKRKRKKYVNRRE